MSVECVVRGVCCQLSVLSAECIVSGVLSAERARTQPSFFQTDDGVDAETSLSLSLQDSSLHFLYLDVKKVKLKWPKCQNRGGGGGILP